MSGIETAGLVFAGIAAYKSSHELFSNWRERRPKKKRAQKEKKVVSEADSRQPTDSLVLGEPRISEEYNRDYGLLGEVFKAGDSMFNGWP